MDKFSSDKSFFHQVLAVPLCEEYEGEEIMSPQLSKADFLNGGARVSNLVIKQ